MIANGENLNGNNGGLGGECALNMSKGKDREHLRRAVVNGWGDLSERMAKYLVALDEALGLAKQEKNAREIRGCVNTLKTIVDQIQKEEHHAEGEKIDQSITVEYVNKWDRAGDVA